MSNPQYGKHEGPWSKYQFPKATTPAFQCTLPQWVFCDAQGVDLPCTGVTWHDESDGIIKGFGEIFELDAFLCRSLQ